MFAFTDHLAGTRVRVAFTDAAHDLGDRATPDVRAATLAELRQHTDADPVLMSQVHGIDVAVVGEVPDEPPEADAVVSAESGLALVTRVADCVPVLIADAEGGVIAAVHAGRAGVAAGVVNRAITTMRDLGAGALVGWIGPHICGGCYEVPEQMRAEVAATVPAAYAVTTWGTPALDLGAGVAEQLAAHGCRVVHASRCTREATDLHSHRRDGAAAGRSAGVIWKAAA